MAEIAARAFGRGRVSLSLPLILGVLVYAWLLSKAREILGDPDTYLHIAVGRWIVAQGAVPHQGIFSATMADAPWVMNGSAKSCSRKSTRFSAGPGWSWLLFSASPPHWRCCCGRCYAASSRSTR